MQTGILDRHTSFITLHFIGLYRFFFKTNWNFVATLCWADLNSIFSLCVSVSRFGNSCNISNVFIIIVFVLVISDLWCHHCNCFGTPGPHPCKTVHLLDTCCVCSDCSTDTCLPVSLPCLWPSYSRRHMDLEFRPVNNTTMTLCLSERKSHMSLILNKKLEMIQLSEESMSKAKTDPKLGLLWQSAKL